jgi:hypothetical protein
MKPEDRQPPLPDVQDDDFPTEADREARMKERQRHDERLDEGVEETFPASDPVAVKHIS